MTTLTIDERDGKPSASAAWRIRNCPGSVRAPRTIPADDSTPDSRKGDRIHGRTAFLIVSALNAMGIYTVAPDEVYNWVEPLEDPGEEELADSLAARALRQTGILLGTDDRGVPLIDEAYIEMREWFVPPGAEPQCSGKADFVAYGKGSDDVVLIDHKSGWGDQDEAADNDQIRWLVALNNQSASPTRKCFAWINQIGNDDPPAVFDSDAIEDALVSMANDINATWEPDPTLAAGGWCQYCPARNGCRVRTALLPDLAAKTAQIDPHQLPDNVLSMLLDQWAIVKKLGPELEAEMKERVASGGGEGWELQPGRRIQKIFDVALVADRLHAAGAPYNEILEGCTITKKSIEHLGRSYKGLKGGGLRKWMDDEILAGCVEETTSAPSLKRAKLKLEGGAA